MSTILASSSVSSASRVISWGRFIRVGLATVVAATLANTIFYFIGGAVIAYDPTFVVLAGVSGTILFTLAGAIGAVLVYAAQLRFARNPMRTFRITSTVVLVASFVPDFTYIPTVAGSTNGQIAILVLMHVIAAAVIVWMLTSFVRPQERAL